MQHLQLNSTLQGGKYIIKKVLGQGGFGITYLAEHDLLGTKVAIKEFFMKDFCNREETTSHVSVVTESGREQVVRFREKFLKEARNIARLRHPNIVRISDVFEENGTAYYVMDYCEGGSLSELLKLHPNGIGEPLALKYVRQVASALEQVHAMKMNHLDIKPANILLDAQGNAVIIDFGLAKQYDVTTGNQTSTTPVGISHGYAPMEQYKQGGVSEFSPATDIYSLGATLFKLITGQTPPEAQVLLEEELPAFVATQNVTTAIRKAMQVRRLDRPQSIKEWMNLLGESSTSNTCSSNNETSTSKQEVEDESTCIENGVWQEEEASRQQELKAKAEREAKAAEEAKRHAEEVERKSREDAERRRIEEERRRANEEKQKVLAEKEAKKKSKNKTIFSVIGIVAVIAIIIALLPSKSNYEKGLECSKKGQYTEAFNYYYKGAQEGDPSSMAVLGQCYLEGQGVVPDTAKAFTCFETAAEKGNLYGIHNLGICYLWGWGTPFYPVNALDCFEKAAMSDFFPSIYTLACYYAGGRHENAANFTKAKEYLDRALQISPEEVDKDLVDFVEKKLECEKLKEKSTALFDKAVISESKEVDLGLSVIWSGYNVGASSSTQYGDLFAFGDPTGKKKRADVDILEPMSGSNDIAHAKWGGSWRLPTKEECEELIDKCAFQGINYKGVNGMKIVGPNGNAIFLPAAGRVYNYGRSLAEETGNYFTCDVEDAYGSLSGVALHFDFSFDPEGKTLDFEHTGWNCSVRPVRDR